ncbi:MAG: family 78 glycoside hydrolase catalytic domain [Eubacteriales bacterium]|nr:family 78 glycoside hydrolase catalytic domain [Eubacteriales bacterium]
MNLYDFRIEYRENPRGLMVARPRFSWKIASGERNVSQRAYRLRVVSGGKIFWDSERRESAQSVLVEYAGEPLEEEQEYRVSLLVEDNYGNRAEAEMEFSTGIWNSGRFRAEMITHDFPEEEEACPVFSRKFPVRNQVVFAGLYATAHGVYEAILNGNRIGDVRMAPGWTDYRKILLYQYYDVTRMIQAENTLEFTVGNGWYKGILGFDCRPDCYGTRTGIWGELHLRYADGSEEVIATDERWEVRTGQIRYSEIYMGETIDTAAPESRTGRVVIDTDFCTDVLTPQIHEPVRITEYRRPVRSFTDPEGNRVVDFGQNLTGDVELRICGKKGQRITIRHAETLDQNGVFYPDTLRTARSTDTYVLNGEEQVLAPHFTFHGFRYIAVEGAEHMEPEMFTARVMHSDMRKTGEFYCSNEKVNRLQNNIAWSLRGNFLDIPTDCPQRDERLGWMGDAQVFSWTAAFNRETALFFTKWMRDVAAASSLENGVPHVVPDLLGSFSSAAWSDAAVVIPWVVYQTYGDVRILEESWQCMHEWVDYIGNHTDENGLWMTGYQYGDWLALDREMGDKSVGATDVYLVANACYLYVTDLVAKTACVLGKEEEAAYYRAIRERTLESFRREYYTERGRVVSETQTGCALSLYFGLARGEHRERILRTLVTNIENHQNHLTTGFVGTPYLCHALSENGAHETASLLFMREDLPSWLYAVNQGATTLWERWDAILPDGTMQHPGLNSMNHYANGAIGDWMYRKIGGINQLEAGYHRVLIRPMLVRGIEEATTAIESPYGRIVSHWRCREGIIRVEVKIPANTGAVIYLPERAEPLETGSGEYVFEYETQTSLQALRFTMDSTLGEIMEEEEGQRLVQEMLPEIFNSPMIEYAKRMTLAEGISAAPEVREVYGIILKRLNEGEKGGQ